MKKLFGTIAFVLLLQTFALADISVPGTPKPKKTPTPAVKTTDADLYIDISSEVTEPTLIVRTGTWNKLRAEAGDPGDDNVAAAGFTSFPTIIGGIFLSLAIVFGGIWLVRSGTKVPKIAVGAVLMAVLGAATVIVGNVAPPRNFGITQDLFRPEFAGPAYARGKVKVKVDPNNDGQDFRLLIPYRQDGVNKEE